MNRRLRRKLRVGAHMSAEKSAKIWKTVLLVLSALLILIVLTVIWGNSLKKKADQSQKGNDTEPVGTAD